MIFGQRTRSSERPRAPRGHRAYAVGDIHGRLDLLDQLLAMIERDVERSPARKSLLIFLGDLIDRGPDSRGVVERLRTYHHARLQMHVLAGNHEEILLRLLAGERGILDGWLKFGGAECLRSYGTEPSSLDGLNERDALALVQGAIPREHKQFLCSLADTISFGDYLFVHAGIRPGLDLSLQSQFDLRWIRAPFLDCEDDHGVMIVHGHTISEAVDERPNRIGIDTGAYRTGVLSALVVEGEHRFIIDTDVAEPKQAVVMR